MITYDEKTETHLLYDALIKHVEVEHALYMNRWWVDNECHTYGCIAGWVGYLTGDTFDGLSQRNNWALKQAHKLRLTPNASEALFHDIEQRAAIEDLTCSIENQILLANRVAVLVLKKMRGILKRYPDYIFDTDDVNRYIDTCNEVLRVELKNAGNVKKYTEKLSSELTRKGALV